MKICPNPKCSRFGRIVYALDTRCPVCKWDLKPPLASGESRAATPVDPAPSR